MINNKIFILTFLISYVSFAQEKMVKGKITAGGNNVEGINLMNLVNEKSAVTNANGEFSILAKAEDLLIFSAENFYYKRKIIEVEDLKQDVLIIEMEPKPIEIEEVVITKFDQLTAYGLGIIDYIPKQYTVGERRMMSKVGSLAERKARVEGEKKLMLIEKLEHLFDEEYFTKTLKINSDYVMAFKYYCSEQKDFTKVVNSKIKNDIRLSIIELAQKFNALQNEKIVEE